MGAKHMTLPRRLLGARSGLAGGTALTLADCLIGLRRLEEASQYPANIDAKVLSPLTGDPDVGAGISFAQAEIATKEPDYTRTKQFLDSVRAVFPALTPKRTRSARWRKPAQ